MKKENFLRIVFSIFFLLITIFAIVRFSPVETQLLQGFIRPEGIKNQQLLKLANLSSSTINVIFEADDYEDLALVKEKFVENFDFGNIKFADNDFSKILEIYKNNPENFLSKNTKKLLSEKKYSEVANESLKRLYNPLAIYIQTPDIDPYLLVTDYVMSLQNSTFTNREAVEFDGKIYSLQQLELTNGNNDDVEGLLNYQKLLNSDSSGEIYLTGTPIHSAVTSKKSAFEINIICLISTLALILLSKFYFRSFKILFPIVVSISFGLLFGYLACNAIFGGIHILTFVFSTTLIGISLDYSLHYFLAREHKDFSKNLTSSMLTTVLTFLLLLFSGVEILKQIAIYTSFGLVSVYSVVSLFFPYLKGFEIEKKNSIELPDLTKYKKIILPVIIGIILVGLCKISFNDDIKNLYNPSKSLLKAEILYKKAFEMPDVSFLTVRGENYDSIIAKEEQISKILDEQNIEYYSLSKILPSIETQKENQKLVKELYISNLDEYANFLNKNQRDNLKKSVKDFVAIDYGSENFDMENKFLLDKNTSFMVVFDADDFEYLQDNDVNFISVSKNITKELKHFRELCLKILPFMFGVLFILLILVFKFKKACKIILPPFLGTCFAIAVLSLFNQPLNMFNILAMFLIMGFSIDYSIFRASGDKNSKDAVLISFISSAMSFSLLSFTSFKLISSLGLVLFLGISISYILSLVLISEEETETM